MTATINGKQTRVLLLLRTHINMAVIVYRKQAQVLMLLWTRIYMTVIVLEYQDRWQYGWSKDITIDSLDD